MFEKVIRSPQDVESVLIQRDSNYVHDGNVLHIDDDMVPTPLDDDYDNDEVYGFTRSLRGSDEIIPSSRVAFVTPYNGVYVPNDHMGFSVQVPVRGRRDERAFLAWFEQPSRHRYILESELRTRGVSEDSLGRLAVARAVYEVAHGIGEEKSDEIFARMELRADQNREEGRAHEKREELIRQEMFRIEPRLEAIYDEQLQAMFDSVRGGDKAERAKVSMLEYWALRDKVRPVAIANLGFEPEEPVARS